MLDRLVGLELDHLVVATSTERADDAVVAVAVEAGVPVVRGPEADVLGRFGIALQACPADTIVRLTADCPLTDGQLVSRVLSLHRDRNSDYTCNVLPRTFPRGLDVEVMSAPVLEAAIEEAADPAEREHVTPFIYRRPERFRLANLRHGEFLGRERWTVDTSEDLAFVRGLVEHFSPRIQFPWEEAIAVTGKRWHPPPGSLILRPAMEDDSDLVLRLRNDAASVENSISGRPVDEVEHRRWYAARVEDPGCRLLIAEVDACPVGNLRVDVRDGVGEVSIVVVPGARRRGYGSLMLQLLEDELRQDEQVTKLTARVRETNEASLRAFQRAGFAETQRDGPFIALTRRRPDAGEPNGRSAG